MAKRLYWRLKINGKWTWRPVKSMNIHWDECKCDKYPLDHGACPYCMEEEE